jgi:hypothetical protein
VIDPDLICQVGQRIREYQMVHRGKGWRELFAALGVDEETAAHMARHALEFTDEIEPKSFGFGLLFGLLTSLEVEPPKFSDADFAELLGG